MSAADVQRELAEDHGPGKCVSVEDANRVLAQERAGVQALIADAERRAAARAWEAAASIGGYYSQQHGPVVPLWALRARAAALDPSGAAEGAGR